MSFLDFFGFPPNRRTQQTMFWGTGQPWQTWDRPRGIAMLHIFCMGSGASGGNGAVAGTSGDGGGSGAATNLLISASCLPDRLFVQAGRGGHLGSGNRSFVSAQFNSTTAADLVLASGAAAATSGVGAGGLAETIATVGLAILASGGLWSARVGAAGGNGSSGGAGGASTALGIWQTCGGGAGSFGANNGGAVTGAGLIPTIAGGLASGGKGNGGYNLTNPVRFTGGSGGAGHTAGTAGNGGVGGPGGGGGGGGSPSTSGTAGTGGDGGPGLVIITCW